MSPAAPPQPLTRLDLLHAFLRILLAFTALLSLVAAMHYWGYYRAERGLLEASERLNVELARSTIASEIAAVVTDLTFLAEDIREQGLLDRDTPAERGRIAAEFRAFARNKGLYDQIRYLDTQGREAVRVNFDGGAPRIVPELELQDKSSRYYTEQAMGLPPGGIYLSPLDLNVEGGAVEQPLKPMLRFAIPLLDTAGRRRGLLVLNYFGQRLIDRFIQAAANIADHVQIVNGEGYWLYSPDPEDAWGFMFGRQTTFAARYPRAWAVISGADQGQTLDPAGLFTFASLHPLDVALAAVAGTGHGAGTGSPAPDLARRGDGAAVQAGAPWHIVSRVDPATLAATPLLFLRRHAALYLAMFALVALGSLLLARARVRHAQAEAQGEYERLFRRTLENIDLVAVSIDGGGRVTFCNDHFLEVTGWRRDDVIGQDWTLRFIPPEYRDQVHCMIAGASTPELFPTRHEVPVMTRAGDSRLVAWNNTLSFDAAGGFVGITCIGDDVTERRRTEAELRKVSWAVEQSPSIVIITDAQGFIEYVNPKFTEVSGYTAAEVIGRNPRLLRSGATSPDEYRGLWESIRAGGEWRGEFHNRRKDGSLYWEAASISGIRAPDGAITHFVAVKEDITERKRLEQEVDARNRELARTQSLTALGRMSSMVAHDLRNPLSSVKMAVQILSRHAGSDQEAVELGQIALTQIRYMEDILADMLAFARPGAIAAEWIGIDKLIDGALGMAQGKIAQSGVRVTLDIQPGLPPLYGDAGKLRQALCNLIVNAAQAAAGEPDGAIGIAAMLHLGGDGTGVQVEICDNGPGIDAEARDKLFEPFFTTKAQGTGLGLAIVRRILEQHGAEIRLETVRPRGTRAALILPTRPTEATPQPPGDGVERSAAIARRVT